MQKLKDFFNNLKTKIKWATLVASLRLQAPKIKEVVSVLIMNAFRISGGVYGWVIGIVVSKITEKTFDELAEEAAKEDQKNIDEKKVEVYEEKIKEGGTSEDVVKAGSDFLNDDNT